MVSEPAQTRTDTRPQQVAGCLLELLVQARATREPTNTKQLEAGGGGTRSRVAIMIMIIEIIIVIVIMMMVEVDADAVADTNAERECGWKVARLEGAR